MRYVLISVAISLVIIAVVPAVYSGLDVEGETYGAVPGLTSAPTVGPDAPGAVRTPRAAATAATGAALGQQIAQRNACLGCHSITGATLVGPSWKGLAGSTRQLQGGGSAVADDAYLRESIVSPTAKVAVGATAGAMPTNFGASLTADEISALVEYIKTLK